MKLQFSTQTLSTMLSIVSFSSLSCLDTVTAKTEATFSYDPHAETGPDNWGKLDIENNQCNGMSNSPIAIETHHCDRYEDYVFNVSFYSPFFFSPKFDPIEILSLIFHLCMTLSLSRSLERHLPIDCSFYLPETT